MEEKWDLVIEPKRNLLDLKLKQLWYYRDLLYLFVKRDIIIVYTQTVLGPLWFFVQPIITLFVYTFVFGKIAAVSTDGLPRPLFYLPGIICWNYFAECLLKNSTVFRDNFNLFSKVYFPRIILPMSIVFSSMVRFFIQMSLFVVVLLFYYSKGLKPEINSSVA
jgi:lipopolysaccharide transport system permease protein